MSETTYDLLPYEDFTFPTTHPEHLFCVAAFLGHAAPDPHRARVLELGCAAGANLVPMALDLAQGAFTGIDLSAQQIAEGRVLVERLGLANVTLEALSITDFDAPAATFDYVICHGVYSWVPPVVRRAILDLCARVLAPNGVAYVSYNTLPGWSLGKTLRDYFLFHTNPHDAPTARVASAREASKLLVAALASRSDAASAALRAEAESLRDVGDSYLFHEYLEEANEPIYYREFVASARASGLDCFADADLTTVVRDALARGAGDTRDAVTMEQSVDFFRNRRFRASLLVHGGTARASRPDLARVVPFHLATSAELAEDTSEAALRSDAPLAFHHHTGRFTLRDPVAKTAMAVLAEAERRPVAFTTLCDEITRRTRIGDPARIAMGLARDLDLVGRVFDRVVELRSGPARYEPEASLRPVACPLARDQAMRGAIVTNRRHAQLELEPFERRLVPLLDGTRDRSAIAEAIATGPRDGDLAELDVSAGALAARVEGALEWLAVNALLVE